MKDLVKGLVKQVFSNIIAECQDIISDLGLESTDYIIHIYPFSIDRIDGKPVEEEILFALENKFINEVKEHNCV